MKFYVFCPDSFHINKYHGDWVKASKNVETMQKKIDKILKKCKVGNSARWEISDVDNIPSNISTLEEIVEWVEFVGKYKRKYSISTLVALYEDMDYLIYEEIKNIKGVYPYNDARSFTDALADGTVEKFDPTVKDFFNYEDFYKIYISYNDVIEVPDGVAVFSKLSLT